VWPVEPTPFTGSTDALSFSGKLLATAMASSLAYINTSSRSFETARVQRKHRHTEEELQATIVLIDHIHKL
jgi:hypothetical protein